MTTMTNDDAQMVNSQIDNPSSIALKVARLYADRLMSDICLIVGNEHFPSHRLILCASSDVFKVMLLDGNWAESQVSQIILKESEPCADVFEDFLRYMYTGKIKLDYATVVPLVSLADKYNVKDLLAFGLQFMLRNISLACKKSQIIDWYQFALASGHSHIADLCWSFIKSNFEQVAESIDFRNLETCQMLRLLQANDLVVTDEITLFKYFDAWLQEQEVKMLIRGEDHIQIHVDNLVRKMLLHIRFPMMAPSELASLTLYPLCSTHMELLVDRIRLAMQYHKNCLTLSAIKSTDPRLFTPRLYTTDRFSSSLDIDYLPNLRNYYCRSLLLSCQRFIAEYCGDEHSEWLIDVYPKGVWINKCLTVYSPQGLEVPERVLKTVRVSISTKDETEQRVRIGLLISAIQDGFEHIIKTITRIYFFSKDDQIVNLDDIVDFDALNCLKHPSPFLVGPSRETFRVRIVITPLSKISSLCVT